MQLFSQKIDNFEIPLEAIMTEPIYGEENAPDTIYYKYIRNNPSEGFLYSLFRLKDNASRDLIVIFIIPLQGEDAIFIILDETFNFIVQHSIIYYPHLLPYSKGKMLYLPKYLTDYTSLSDLYDFFTDQLEFNYKLIYREDLLSLLDTVLPQDVRVYIDKFEISDPKYIRKQNMD